MLGLAAITLLGVDLLNDPVITGYVERLCHRLASDAACMVSVDSAARAASRPGEGIRITTGMIVGAKNEAELAGILAHEIAHLHSEHAPPQDEDSGLCLRFAGHEAKFEGAKQWEMEADRTAIAMLMKAGYDPAAMLRYFSTLRHADPDLPRTFSAEDILIERLQLEATDHPMKDPVTDSPEFQAVRERLK